MQIIVKTCVILHNMIIDSKRDVNEEFTYDGPHIAVQPNPERDASFSDFIQNAVQLRNSEVHYQLRDDLVKHLWALKGTGGTETDEDTG
ncbi:hypothetical protein PSTG_03219 [Puccinia striiformis f. sp. tritici PST-78]|uniref:Uncharacterized protein n=1 Tax=Puccinia striiformis f. sp. tritici PST-78 TaxID=1165861 RepID=A0A0L0VWQ3_9BASI|nr:hypothetical protein PSTG_03219 [Puccinia striiformis f. sp. tritici PST-78]